jgi:hypothetical protein
MGLSAGNFDIDGGSWRVNVLGQETKNDELPLANRLQISLAILHPPIIAVPCIFQLDLYRRSLLFSTPLKKTNESSPMSSNVLGLLMSSLIERSS